MSNNCKCRDKMIREKKTLFKDRHSHENNMALGIVEMDLFMTD